MKVYISKFTECSLRRKPRARHPGPTGLTCPWSCPHSSYNRAGGWRRASLTGVSGQATQLLLLSSCCRQTPPLLPRDSRVRPPPQVSEWQEETAGLQGASAAVRKWGWLAGPGAPGPQQAGSAVSRPGATEGSGNRQDS